MNTKILDFNTNLDSILELDLFNRYQELIFITDDIETNQYAVDAMGQVSEGSSFCTILQNRL